MPLAAEYTADVDWKEVVLVFGVTKCWKQSSSGGEKDLSIKNRSARKKRQEEKETTQNKTNPKLYTLGVCYRQLCFL